MNRAIIILITLLTTIATLDIKTISSQCLCDISSGCDYECCCDGGCSKILTDQLKKYGKCDDDGFGIPWCSGYNETDMNVKDLHSGLHTIYTIIKRLFCLEAINIAEVPSFYTQEADTTTLDTLQQTALQSSGMISVNRPSVGSLDKQSVGKIFLTDSMGFCSITNEIPKLQKIPSKGAIKNCRTALEILDIQNHPILSTVNLLSGSSFSSISLYSINQATTANPTLVSSVVPSCGSGTCTNILRFLKLYLSSTGSIDTTYSYGLIGDIEASQSNNITYVDVKYSYEYLDSDSTISYEIGSKLIFLKLVDTSYLHTPNPTNLAYRTGSNNICRSVSQNADNSLVAFQFGKDGEYGCIGSSSLIYENLKNAFSYVGKFGSASTSLADYVEISWPNIDATSSIRLTFNYIKIGSASNWQYYIIRVDVAAVQSISGEQSLYVQYMQVTNEKTLYIPEPPKIHAYLPNDFLYPFYVAG